MGTPEERTSILGPAKTFNYLDDLGVYPPVVAENEDDDRGLSILGPAETFNYLDDLGVYPPVVAENEANAGLDPAEAHQSRLHRFADLARTAGNTVLSAVRRQGE